MSEPVQNPRRSPNLLRIGLWIFLLLLVLAQAYDVRSSQMQVRKGLKSYAELCARRWAKWSEDLEFALIALVEQRAIREGFARLNQEGKTSAWAQGFLQALDGASRFIMVSSPGVEDLTFRSLDGIKQAGSGAERDSIAYPDPLMRSLRRKTPSGSDPYAERIVVPIRAADASPIAFLALGIHRNSLYNGIFNELAGGSDTLLLLVDRSGESIWSSNAEIAISDLQPDLRAFEYNRKVYWVENAELPGTDQRLYAAFLQNEESVAVISHVARNIAPIVVILLLVWSYELSLHRKKKASPEQGSAR